jgi:hypothetical protein
MSCYRIVGYLGILCCCQPSKRGPAVVMPAERPPSLSRAASWSRTVLVSSIVKAAAVQARLAVSRLCSFDFSGTICTGVDERSPSPEDPKKSSDHISCHSSSATSLCHMLMVVNLDSLHVQVYHRIPDSTMEVTAA